MSAAVDGFGVPFYPKMLLDWMDESPKKMMNNNLFIQKVIKVK